MIYDAEHFFDAFRDDPAYALRCLRAAVDGGAENVTLCDTNGSSLPAQVAAATARVVGGARARTWRSASTPTTTRASASRTPSPRSSRARGWCRARQRLRRALRQRQPGLDPARAPAQDGLRVRAARAARAPHRDRAPDRRDLQPHARTRTSRTSGRNAFAHKGGMHVAGVNQDPRTFEHVEPEAVGNDREVLISELSGKGTVQARAEQTGVELDEASAARVVERVKALEHAGYQFEAADGSFDLLIRKETGEYEPLFRLESWRVIAEKREDGRVQTEATIKIWVDGRALRPHRRGQRPGQRARPRAARRARRDLPAPARHPARRTSRSASSTSARAPRRSRACCSTRATASTRGARSASPRT